MGSMDEDSQSTAFTNAVKDDKNDKGKGDIQNVPKAIIKEFIEIWSSPWIMAYKCVPTEI